ncbi:MAG TPA: methyltransferase domain-containing protein [Gaiellaceae bacterium]|nr:methyltransferase domain-containing protein [Gaiellaceae bacterium]
MGVVDRIREWRVDRMTDRVARRPHGRQARAVYGAEDAHSFLWEPVLAALALRPDDRLLDVGCGGGIFLRRALESGCEGVGLDHSRDMVRVAREKTGGVARIVQAEADAMPFRDGEFTAISSLVAFFFFDRPVAVLREIRRVLDPGRGRIAIMTTAPEAKGTPAAPYPLATRGHFHTDDELVRLALEAGFATARIAHREEWAQLLVAQP